MELSGALIIGQAAVDAGIVSPILIIIVAITGITSFAIPDYYLAFHCRVARFAYIILGYLAGFLGIAFGAIYQYVIGIRRLDIRDRGFMVVIAFITILIICQVLPLIFALIVKGWRG